MTILIHLFTWCQVEALSSSLYSLLSARLINGLVLGLSNSRIRFYLGYKVGVASRQNDCVACKEGIK